MHKWLKRIALGAGILLCLIGVIGAGAGLWLHSRMTASLAVLDGERRVSGLSAPVVIERDELGVPTIRAASRADLARATGWLHAQDRFMQMDLMRRQAAGELAEILGPAVLATDRRNRVHRFRWRAERNLRRMDPRFLEIAEAYTEGVNAGLEALGAAPPEYLLLGVDPEPWRREDTILVLLGMFLLLQGDNGHGESVLGLMHEALPRELFDFLVPEGTEWDAPLIGGTLPCPAIPGSDVVDLRSPGLRSGIDPSRELRLSMAAGPHIPGSNNWAVAGQHTADGGALIANDMHLPLSLPPIWYRASLVWVGDRWPDGSLRSTGVTLPGAPAMIVGSNGFIAWGFTNAGVDSRDLVVLTTDPADENRYLTPEGYRDFETDEEILRVKGGEEETLVVKSTIWGPVIDEDERGRLRALRWVAHDQEAVNYEIIDLEQGRTVEDAVAVARRSGVPAQNLVVADRDGRIAWTMIGILPRRFGHDGMVPASWADGQRGWDGWLEPHELPTVINPDSGRIWTANNRVVGEESLPVVGVQGYDLGARAGQIRDGLLTVHGATIADMLEIQLDDRALFLERWRDLLLELLTTEAVAADPRKAEVKRLVEENWTGRASVDSAAYRLVRGYRQFLARQLFAEILSARFGDDPPFEYTYQNIQWEGPLWKLVTSRPHHMLAPRFDDWDAQLLGALDDLLDYYEENFEGDLAERTWGERNTSSISHPLSSALPQLSRWLDVEPHPLPGDKNMPRVQAPSFGASERFAVSPGREEQGYMQVPGGQSGHPLSPFYRAGHLAWENGEPTPFLPGPPAHQLTLIPE